MHLAKTGFLKGGVVGLGAKVVILNFKIAVAQIKPPSDRCACLPVSDNVGFKTVLPIIGRRWEIEIGIAIHGHQATTRPRRSLSLCREKARAISSMATLAPALSVPP